MIVVGTLGLNILLPRFWFVTTDWNHQTHAKATGPFRPSTTKTVWSRAGCLKKTSFDAHRIGVYMLYRLFLWLHICMLFNIFYSYLLFVNCSKSAVQTRRERMCIASAEASSGERKGQWPLLVPLAPVLKKSYDSMTPWLNKGTKTIGPYYW